MNDEPNPNPPSLTELLCALIPALILFFAAILAEPNRPQTPAMRRLARYVRYLRAVATLFRITIPEPRAAIPHAKSASAPRPKSAPVPRPTRSLLWSLIPAPHPEPARTLEL